MKCCAKYCFHEHDDNVDIITIGKRKYHEDCYQTSQDIKEVINIFSNNINKNVVFSQLRNVINVIVYGRGIPSGMLLLGIKYYVKNNIPLNYPGGLYYVVQNKEVQKLWESTIKKKNDAKFKIDTEDQQSFNFNIDKPKGFGGII